MLLWLKTGFEHITDIHGYDHILFIMVLCGVYALSDWKKVLLLVTAFTLGHSVSLFLAVFQIVKVSAEWVEFLIPVSIFITALFNLLNKNKTASQMGLNYLMAAGFGIIHGLGFSNYLRALLGMEESVFLPLFNFNIGLEIGQIVVLLLVFFVQFLLETFAKVRPYAWKFFISSAICGISFIMLLERLPF